MASRTLCFSFFVFFLLALEASMMSALGRGRRLLSSSSASSPAPVLRNSTASIRASCGATLYTHLCYASLSSYADLVAESPVALARFTANVTAARLRSLSALIVALGCSRSAPLPWEVAALRDCCESPGDTADLAYRSGAELVWLDTAAGVGIKEMEGKWERERKRETERERRRRRRRRRRIIYILCVGEGTGDRLGLLRRRHVERGYFVFWADRFGPLRK